MHFHPLPFATVRRRIAAALLLLASPLAIGSNPLPEDPTMHTATGAFDVKMTPEADTSAESGSARLRLDKTYHGPLQATAVGTMLGARTAVEGSAGYVAIERVTGTLGGRQGSFVLQHFGVMEAGSRHLDIRVVPGSGEGGLEGLRGTMSIRIEAGGAHFYTLEYTLP
jgi:hypothetical protein